MCLVIDICTLAPVFEKSCAKHSEFKPVLDWILYGNGKIIYGGEKYKNEIPQKYLRLINELTKASKAIELIEQKVNEKTKEIKKKYRHRDFDDPHIVAIIIVSGYRVICSDDDRAYPFFKMKMLYPNRFTRPKIYSGASNKNLLNDNNIVKICKPCLKLNKNLAKNFAYK